MKLMQVTQPNAVFQLIEKHFTPLTVEERPLEEAGGRYLAATVTAPEDSPAFNRSTVDGYAVAARDTFGAGDNLPALLECAGEGLMGQTAPAISAGQCLLVHTGGMLPEGTDAVVMVEHVEPMGTLVHCYRQVAPGENVIRRGEDLAAGEIALARGALLRAPELGLLASLGITTVPVHRRPWMGILSSGDELVPSATARLSAGQIRDSNSSALFYQGLQAGAKVTYGGIVKDSFDLFLKEVQRLLAQVDFLVLSGGSSVGARDYTARTLQELGPPGLLVEGIAIQPGKPTLLAKCSGKPVLGLPGHPISALIIFSLFGIAILDRLAGRAQKPRFKQAVRAALDRNLPSRSGRTDYVRVRLREEDGLIKASPIFGRSGMLRTLAEADGIITVPSEKEGLVEGTAVDVFLWE